MKYDKGKYLGKRIILGDRSLAEIEDVDDLGFTIRVIAGGPFNGSLQTGDRHFYNHFQLNFKFADKEEN